MKTVNHGLLALRTHLRKRGLECAFEVVLHRDHCRPAAVRGPPQAGPDWPLPERCTGTVAEVGHDTITGLSEFGSVGGQFVP